MTAAAPAATQKTIAYLENTGQTIFEGTVGTNNSSDTGVYAILHEDGFLKLNANGSSKIEMDSDAVGFTLQNNNGDLDIDAHVNIIGGHGLKIAGSELSTSDLSDGTGIARLGVAQTFTAAQTFDDLRVATSSDITRGSVTDYLDLIDRMHTDYRRRMVSTELFGSNWTTPTLYKEYQTNGTLYTGSGSAPTYAEITLLKWARSLSSPDASHSSKFSTFTHNTNTNTPWSLSYSSAAEGAKKSGVFTVQVNFNGNNRGASTTRFTDFAFIGNTWVSGASCRVDIHNNIHGVNDATPDYTPISTSCTYHANASTSSNEFANAEQPVFLLKNAAASSFELVLRFPISNTAFGTSYGYVSDTGGANAAQDAEFLRKKNVNVDVRVKQVDTWEHFPTDFTSNDYSS